MSQIFVILHPEQTIKIEAQLGNVLGLEVSKKPQCGQHLTCPLLCERRLLDMVPQRLPPAHVVRICSRNVDTTPPVPFSTHLCPLHDADPFNSNFSMWTCPGYFEFGVAPLAAIYREELHHLKGLAYFEWSSSTLRVEGSKLIAGRLLKSSAVCNTDQYCRCICQQ